MGTLRQERSDRASRASGEDTSRHEVSSWLRPIDLLGRGWRALRSRDAAEAKNIESFSEDEQQEILLKRDILASLAYFIGKDFRLPVYLGAPGSGWFWDPQRNAVTIDSADVLRNPLSYLRFVTCHEGAHRRISRLSEVPSGLLEKPGFMMLLNGVEDPRVNNYICDAYPIVERDMREALTFSLDKVDAITKTGLQERGFVPHSVTALTEIIREWFQDRTRVVTEGTGGTLSPDVREFLKVTRPACERAYNTYPLRKETERGEYAAFAYSKAAYQVIAQQIWPHFEKLLEADRKGAEGAEAFKQMAESAKRAGSAVAPSPSKKERTEGAKAGLGHGADQENGGTPPDAKPDGQQLEDKSSGQTATQQKESKQERSADAASDGASSGAGSGEKKQNDTSEDSRADGRGEPGKDLEAQGSGDEAGVDHLRKAIEGALSGSARAEVARTLRDIETAAKAGHEVHSGDHYQRLSQETRDELERSVERLSEQDREMIRKAAREFLERIQREISDQLEGQLSLSSKQEEEIKSYIGDSQRRDDPLGPPSPGSIRADLLDEEAFRGFRSRIHAVFESEGDVYDSNRKQVLEVMNHLEQDLRKLFQERRASALQEGQRYGPGLDLDHRISECAAGVPAVDTRSFTRRSRPLEKDYAISLLVDLSGSMRSDNRMSETFKATIALAEVLNRLGINFEIIGFNDSIHEYKVYWKRMSPGVREKMGSMMQEIHTSRARYNDDGWALTVASDRLRRERQSRKFLIVLSDGRPEPSPQHATPQYELSKVIKNIRKQGDMVLIGLGVGEGTKHVSTYYPNSSSDISTEQLPEKLAEILEQAIRHPEMFSK